jgi:ABC-type tungstate transport system substrate-binding protein
MKLLITKAALILGAAMMIAPAQAQTVDQLLEQVRTGSLQKTQAATDLEARFASAGAGKAGIVSAWKG